MRQIFYILILVSVLSSCSEYQNLLKSEDISVKFNAADSLYNIGKYEKANKLFAQIVPSYRGKPQAEKLMFLYSDTFYKMKEYYNSGYQFERFVSSYPNSEKLEEAAFLGAKSYYMQSPVYSKDQTETIEALDKIQNFINLFPDSEYVEEANMLFKELDFKLEKKAFEIAKQYKLIAPGYTRNFDAAITSFDNFIFEFPGSSLREDALFLKFDAAYQQAINSYETKIVSNQIVPLRRPRLLQAKEFYNNFKNSYADSKYMEEANMKLAEIDKALEEYSNKS
ncbi:outer membrane protein assembly factor BamD [Flavobacteriaceae bacterium XHP0103]|uniref:outer membrane protein assembly factor BamD n=1 Tax=Marixanthotalea marina TaxID=2844359 RepID=UPI002989A9B6|nr:outer membrane protein assembly factor BamD [Marixanthotalea marina]MBU3822565.1 outer membrane protein assembly factor BamD [Marixanthotalea marina]